MNSCSNWIKVLYLGSSLELESISIWSHITNHTSYNSILTSCLAWQCLNWLSYQGQSVIFWVNKVRVFRYHEHYDLSWWNISWFVYRKGSTHQNWANNIDISSYAKKHWGQALQLRQYDYAKFEWCNCGHLTNILVESNLVIK